MYWVNCAVEPEPSECTTGMIGSDGSLRPLLSAVISGSSQLVIWLVKIFGERLAGEPQVADQLAAHSDLVRERRAARHDRQVGVVRQVDGRRVEHVVSEHRSRVDTLVADVADREVGGLSAKSRAALRGPVR